MKNLFKRIITLILVLSFVLSIAPIGVFAGGGGGGGGSSSESTVNRNVDSKTLQHYSGASNNTKFPGKRDGSEKPEYLTFILSLGRLNNANINTIIVSYYTSASKQTAYKQIINVSQKRGETIANIVGNESSSPTDRNYTFITNGESYMTRAFAMPFSNYEKAAKAVVPTLDTKAFPSPYHKAFDSNGNVLPMQANSSEYITFKADYHVDSIESVSFFASVDDKNSVLGEVQLNGWSLYKGDQTSSIAGSNYAFVSNSFAVSVNAACICKSTDVANMKVVEGINIPTNSMFTYHNYDYIPAYKFDKVNEKYTGNMVYFTAHEYQKYFVVDHTFNNTDSSYGKFGKEPFWETVDIRETDDTAAWAKGYEYYGSADMYMSDIQAVGDKQLLCCQTVVNGRTYAVSDGTLYDGRLNFEIKIADEYGAGIEKFNVAPTNPSASNPLNLEDVLIARIVYKDSNGMQNTFDLPVISNAILTAFVSTSEYELQNSNFNSMFLNSELVTALKSGQFVEYAQEGSKIVFGVQIPSFTSLEALQLTYKDPSAGNDIQLGIESVAVYSNYNNAIMDMSFGYDSTQSDINDSRYGVRSDIFNSEGSWATTGIGRDKYIRDFSNSQINVSAKTQYSELMFVSTNDRTIWISNETERFEIPMEDVRKTPAEQKVVPAPDGNFDDKYLITLKTDKMDAASTSGEVMVQFNYVDVEGKERESMEYSIKELCSSYEGYLDGVFTTNSLLHDTAQIQTGIQSDIAYYYGMQAGHEIHFLITIRGLHEFTGAKFRIEGSSDEWQIGEITITDITSMSGRIMNPFNDSLYFTTVSDNGTLSFSANHSYERIVQGNELFHIEKPLLVQEGEGSTIDFVSSDTRGEGVLRPDMESYEEDHRLPQFMAESDLKFTTAVKNYDVVVHVGNNSQYASGDDSCGSNNMFYFQLQFADGAKSAYILANKQLTADGFRSGVDETFTVSTNKDHGDVVGISIIPDDLSSNSNPTDKLCIDSIDVIKRNTKTPDKKFVAENVGWISTSYKDTSQESEKKTRTEYEMAVNVPISYSSYMMNLEIDLAFGAYPEGVDQFVGDMTCDLYFETSSGEVRSRTYQVVQGLYEYKNKTAPNGTNGIAYMSDPKTMFRENHTDKFFVSVEDCVRVTKIVLHGNPQTSTKLNLKAINIYALKSKGTLVLSELEGDYTRVFDDSAMPVLVAELESQPQRACTFTAGTANATSFYLSSSEFPNYDIEQEIETIVSRVPMSATDTINMYLYLADGSPLPSNVAGGTGSDIQAGFVYSSTKYSQTMQVSTDQFKHKKIDGHDVIYKEGMTAENMSVINYVWARSNSDITSMYKIDKAVLQQVRNGVVIDTYVAAIDGIYTKKGGTSSKSISSMKSSESSQTVYIQLTEGTPTKLLDPQKTDIAVSLQYRTNSIGSDKSFLISPTVFATDNGVTEIREGCVLEFNFNEYDVKEIVGIQIRTIGDLVVHVGTNEDINGGAIIECNEVINTVAASGRTNSKDLVTRRFSTINCNQDIKGNTGAFTVVSESNASSILRRVDLTFTTKTENNIIDSAGSVPIRAKLQYKTPTYNSVRTFEVADLRRYMSSSGSFGDGGSVTTTFFLPGYVTLVSLELEPYDYDNTNMATWNLNTIGVQAYGADDSEKHTIKVDYSEAIDVNGNPIKYIAEGTAMKFYLYGDQEAVFHEEMQDLIDKWAPQGPQQQINPVKEQEYTGEVPALVKVGLNTLSDSFVLYEYVPTLPEQARFNGSLSTDKQIAVAEAELNNFTAYRTTLNNMIKKYNSLDEMAVNELYKVSHASPPDYTTASEIQKYQDMFSKQYELVTAYLKDAKNIISNLESAIEELKADYLDELESKVTNLQARITDLQAQSDAKNGTNATEYTIKYDLAQWNAHYKILTESFNPTYIEMETSLTGCGWFRGQYQEHTAEDYEIIKQLYQAKVELLDATKQLDQVKGTSKFKALKQEMLQYAENKYQSVQRDWDDCADSLRVYEARYDLYLTEGYKNWYDFRACEVRLEFEYARAYALTNYLTAAKELVDIITNK